jgi:mannose/cellobiose epimerase-like protein (N-acyl-D-glucosamine 2-epimerase family)
MTKPLRPALGAALLAAAALARAALPDGQLWLEHAQHDLLPYWTQPAAQGQPVGRFPTFRCNDGSAFVAAKPCAELRRPPEWIRSELGRDYVRMQGRQIYAYAIGFHLTGDVALLRLAQAGARDMHERALDAASGSFASWFEGGKPGPAVGLRTSQDLAYAGVGLAALYYVTHDPTVLADLTRLKDHVFSVYRGATPGAIKWVAMDDGSGEALRDELVASLDQLNAYLLLVAPALPEGEQRQEWAKDIATLSDYIVLHYYDPASGRFFGTRGKPDSETPRGRHNDFGHTIKAFWMVYLGARLNHNAALEQFAVEGMRKVLDTAYLNGTGSWASRGSAPSRLDEGKEWWIYAELDQAQATLALEQGDSTERLEKTWRYWLDKLTDKARGEVWGWVSPEGRVPDDALKQHQWKNGFHSMEHALVGYLAAQGLNERPATLYYALVPGVPRDTLQPYTFSGTIAAEIATQVDGVEVQQVRFKLQCVRSKK